MTASTGIRVRTLQIVLVVVLSFVVVFEAYIRLVGARDFELLDDVASAEAIGQVDRLIDDDLSQQGTIAEDWAYWDDSYTYMTGDTTAQVAFESANVTAETLTGIGMDVVILAEDDGETRLARSVVGARLVADSPPELLEATKPGGVLRPSGKVGGVSGWMRTSDGTFRVTSRPIINTARDQPPVGLLVFARRVDSGFTSRLTDLTRLPVGITDCTPTTCAVPVERQRTDSTLTTQKTIDGLDGLGAARVSVEQDRRAFRTGIDQLREVEFVIVLLALVASALSYAVFLRRVIARLTRVQSFATEVADGAADDLRLDDPDLAGTSEIHAVAIALNRMLDRLAASSDALAESETRLSVATHAARIGVWEVCPFDRTLFRSDLALELIPGTDDEWIDAKLDLIHPDDREGAVDRFQSALSSVENRSVEYTCRVRQVNGTWSWLRFRAAGAGEGANRRLVGSVEDVSDQRRKEILLAQAKMAAERASAAKSELVSQVSHDLRTPLNAILGFAQLLEMSELAPDDLESVSYILSSGRLLLTIINELLHAARAESGRLAVAISSVDVAPLVKQALTMVQGSAAEGGITLADDLATRSHISVDPQRFSQVLLNLLSNAIKYNAPGGSVTVSSFVSGNELWLSVVDTGRGIPIELVDRVFEPFDRLDADDLAAQGTGIGLTICKSLVELMGGSIEIQSRVGSGTAVTVTFPLAATPGNSADGADSPSFTIFT